MAIIKITEDGNHGTVKFLTDSALNFIRYYFPENIHAILDQESSDTILGLSIKPALVSIHKEDFEHTGEVLLLTAVTKVEEGSPTKWFRGIGSKHALCCRPFEESAPVFEVREIQERNESV